MTEIPENKEPSQNAEDAIYSDRTPSSGPFSSPVQRWRWKELSEAFCNVTSGWSRETNRLSGSQMDAPDTGAVKGTADYFNRENPCGCKSVPDGQHTPGCRHNKTPDAPTCASCGRRSAGRNGVCDHCGGELDGDSE